MPKCPQCGTPNPDDASYCGGCGKKLGDRAGAGETPSVSHRETIHELPVESDGAELTQGAEFAGRYVIDTVIGRGGMGTVYRAHDRLVDKTIALKLIRRDRLGGAESVKRLISEGVTTRDIRHDNVVAVYDVGEAGQQPFVSMEYIEGTSLRAWESKLQQEGKDIPLPVAARIVMEILAGLAAAHAKGVIHRDLKPENIILTAEPSAEKAPLKILDFGIARALGAVSASTTGTRIGTPRYMAPEQENNPDAAGASADFYSISIILYEMLVGVLPQGHWQPPSGGRSDIPAAIDKLIETGLSNRATSRPQDTDDYRRRLEQAMQGHWPRPAQPVQPAYPPMPAAPGGSGFPVKWAAIGGGGLALLVAGAMIVNGLEPAPTGLSGQAGQQVQTGGGTAGLTSQNPYPALSGDWLDANADAAYTVQVNPDGSFGGSGMVAGQPAQIQGGFQGQMARYVVAVDGMQYPGEMRWDGQGHLDWRMADGSAGGRIHINHQPD